MGLIDELLSSTLRDAVLKSRTAELDQKAAEPLPVAGKSFDPYSSDQKGLFGFHGPVRNILGAAVDSFMNLKYDKTPFADRANRSAVSDAMAGYNTDPERAIDLLARVDPKTASELSQKLQTHRLAQMKAVPDINKTNEDWTRQVRNVATQMMNGATEKTYPMLRQRAIDYGKARNMDLSSELPTTYDEEAIGSFIRSSVSVDKQLDNQEALRRNLATEDDRAARLALARERANTDREYRRGQLGIAAAGRGIDAARVRMDAAKTRIAGANAVTSAARNTTGSANTSLRADKQASAPYEGKVRVGTSKTTGEKFRSVFRNGKWSAPEAIK